MWTALRNLFTNRVLYALVAYFGIVCLLVITKPKFLFNKEGDLKPFGFSPHQSPVSFGFISVVMPIVLFYTFLMIDMAGQKRPFPIA